MARKRKNPDTGWRSYGPGKFDSMVDSFLWDATLDGWGDEDTGESDGPGAYTLAVGKLVEMAEHGAKLQNDALTDYEREALEGSAGVILSEDSQGFVSAEYFDTAAQARKAWKQIEKHVAEFYEDEESDESED